MHAFLVRSSTCAIAVLAATACSTPGTTKPDQTAGTAVAAAAGKPAPIHYRSPIEGYRPDTETAPGDWKQVNDTVRAIGGWRTYARESAAASAPAETPQSASPRSDKP